ncbi:protein lifeguard 1 [Xyrichtys novacula]|uniref:Protein lifeguard 1 n=1 Tax=Xyrichtys novacula TaxID=13765 RepID=A0AAV1GI51_XYRNO|nr:protein lifeguard 1 [Xyrichtys novacula]CAJ1072837.1 protein lifeguard 1 [Xyrichtys novacula]
MSDTQDFLQSGETQVAPVYDVSFEPTTPPLPSYSDQEQQPPPYTAAPEMYPPPKEEATWNPELPAGDPDAIGMNPEAPPDTTEPETPSPFEDKTVRRAFVRKVFCIVTLMLLFTFSVVCLFTFSTTVKKTVQDNWWIYLTSIVLFLIVAISLSCCKSLRRRYPWNIVALVLITVSISVMVGTVASFYDTSAVVITMGATLAISVAIIVFSMQTRIDFTFCYGFLLVLLVDFFMFGIFCSFYYSHVADIGYGCLGALLFSLFLMIDVQLLTGSMSHRADPEEYIYAALIIYLDIVLIFLYLMGRR